MGKLWLLTKLLRIITDNPSILDDLRGAVRGVRGRSGADGQKEQRELEMSIKRIEARQDYLEDRLRKLSTVVFIVAGAAVAALVLAIIRLA